MVVKSKKTYVISALFLVAILILCSCGKSVKVSQKSNVSMGSVVTVKTYSSSEQTNLQSQDAVLENINALDMLISKNSEQAKLFLINQKSGEEHVVDEELYQYIKTSSDIFSLSEKKVSVSSGALTQAWGIDNDEFVLPQENVINAVLPLCNDELISFNDTAKSIKTAKGQVINLGAVGKGIACDKAVETLKSYPEIDGAVVSVGGSIALYGSINDSGRFTVGIRNPFGSENEHFATVNVKESFISTSGSYEKTFEINGKKFHHILDLTTGYPVENNLCSVTIIAPNGLVSDALSTMCFVLGEEKSQSVLQKYTAQAVFVYKDKTVSVTQGIESDFSITDNSFKLV